MDHKLFRPAPADGKGMDDPTQTEIGFAYLLMSWKLERDGKVPLTNDKPYMVAEDMIVNGKLSLSRVWLTLEWKEKRKIGTEEREAIIGSITRRDPDFDWGHYTHA
jgi:hypothetical protein